MKGYINSLLGIFMLALFIVGCTNKGNVYKIEGEIKDLTNQKLYIVTGKVDGALQVDSVECSVNGQFSFEGNSDTLAPVIIYMEDATVWTTVWVKNKETISVNGSASTPELIMANGGEVNDLLSSFKEANKDLILEKERLSERKSELANINLIENQRVADLLNINNALKRKAHEFIGKKPESFASLVLLRDYFSIKDNPEEARKSLSLIKGIASETALYKTLTENIENRINLLEQTKVGANAPEFKIVTIDKDTLELNKFKGKYLLISFAASWCKICDGYYSKLTEIKNKAGKNKLELISVAVNDKVEDWKKVIESKKMDWHQTIDTMGWDSQILMSYNIESVPSNVLIDKDGVIVARDLPMDSVLILMDQ